MWGPEQITYDLVYDWATGDISTRAGRVHDYAQTLTEACKQYDGVVFRVINAPF